MTDIDNIMIAATAAKPTIPIPDSALEGATSRESAPGDYTIEVGENGWFFRTPLGASSRSWNDRERAVHEAWEHAAYGGEALRPNQNRAAPDGWVIEPLSRGEWSIRRLYQNRIEETFATRQDAVDAAWKLEVAEMGTVDEPRPREPQEITGGRLTRGSKGRKPRAVVLESPYRGKDSAETAANESYARRAMSDCIRKGEAPFASHLLYTQAGVLDDAKAEERKRGIEAGYLIGRRLGTVVFYLDRGMSPGMVAALEHYTRSGHAIEFRYLDLDEDDE